MFVNNPNTPGHYTQNPYSRSPSLIEGRNGPFPLNGYEPIPSQYFLRNVDMAVNIGGNWKIYDVSARDLQNAKSIRNEASSIVGYTFAADAAVTVDVDGTTFKMFLDASYPDTTWAQPDQEAALVEAMKHGTKLTVNGTSKRKTTVSDTYSLAGISAALDAMAKACP